MKELHRRLLDLEQRVMRGNYPKTGICDAILLPGDSPATDMHYLGLLCDGFEVWPGFSGHRLFPILGGSYAYAQAGPTGRWDAGTKYGQARRELLAFLIDWSAEK